MSFSQHHVVMSCRAGQTSSSSSSKPHSVGYVDQYERHWLRVRYNGSEGFLPIEGLASNRATWDGLQRQGVIVTTQATRNTILRQAETVAYNRRLVVVDRNGWFGAHYVWPGETIPKTIGGDPTYDARPSEARYSRPTGSRVAWRSEVRQLAEGQVLPTFALSCAFAGLLVALLPFLVDNPAYEFCGRDSLGKSTLLSLAASVLGRGSEWRMTWGSTVNALESTMARCADALLALDETGLFLSTAEPGQKRDYRHAIMKLAAGASKARLGEVTAETRRFVLLSSTNIAIGSLLAQFTPEEQAATAVRMITISADAGTGYGVFDRLPMHSPTSADAVARVGRLAEEHFGWAGRDFVAFLERRLATPARRASLERAVQRRMQRFRAAAEPQEVAGGAGRVLDKFALVAAAGELAARWRILPLGGVGKAVLATYQRRAVPAAPTPARQTAQARVQAYYERHRAGLHDITGGHYAELNNAELDAAPGFLKREGDLTWLLLRSSRWNAAFGSDGQRLLTELRTGGRLWDRDGRQAQVKVRSSSNKDRFYRVLIDVPSSATCASAGEAAKSTSAKKLKFRGDIRALKACVAACGLDGEWRKLDGGPQWQFRGESDELLNWWPTTGTINFQGQHQNRFRDQVARAIE